MKIILTIPSPKSGVPSTLVSLIDRCWDSTPQNRPLFDDIVAEFGTILEHRKIIKEPADASAEAAISLDQRLDAANNFRAYQERIDWYSQAENVSKAAHKTNSGAAVWLDASDDASAYHPVLSWGSFATCGRRETTEDTHFLLPHMGNDKGIHCFGISDGHRGAAAAEFSSQALPGFLQELSSFSSQIDALVEAFIKTDIAFRDELNFCRKTNRIIAKNWHPGCTAAAALIVRNKLLIANAGDYRTILCRSGCPFVLSKDHVASCPEERERVINAGGQVKWQTWQADDWRVGPAALQVTRSIGDDDLKPAVTAEPEISETILSTDDEYFVMASDGLWDVLRNEEVVRLIKDTVKEPGMYSKRLATEASARGSKDNIRVIVVFLRLVSTAERIY